jgi:UDP-N-acetyl-D-mannosaminuronic acid dehydrogenase
MLVEEVLSKIFERSLRIVLVGAGYVGLPTAALFADAGFHVDALDIRPEIIVAINNGCSLTDEPGLKELVSVNVKAGRLRGKLNHVDYSQIDAVLVSVQTPIDDDKKPDLHFLMKVVDDVGNNMRQGALIVISSTIPSGTTIREIKPRLESLSGLKADTEFYLAFVPERIAPGKALREFAESTRIVGGVGQNSVRVAAELFRAVCNKVIETDATVAEMAKLAENTYRDVNIAFANQLALLCEQLGVDVMSVIKLANTHPRVNIHLPGPGVGGPCLPKDPYYLLDGVGPLPSDIVLTSRIINDSMPQHIVRLVLQALRNTGKDIARSRIAVLGVAYKNDVDDSRLSPSEPIIHELISLGSQTIVYDPHCKENFGAKSTNSLDEAISGADCLVTVTDHTEFLYIDLQKIKALMNDKPAIVDGRRIISPLEAEKTGFFYCGIGLGDQK